MDNVKKLTEMLIIIKKSKDLQKRIEEIADSNERVNI